MRLWALTAILLLGITPNPALANLTESVDIDFQLASFSKTLTQQTVTQTFQDSRGILWFVTQEGLNRYNGYELENYRYSLTDSSSLSTDRVTGIAEDSNGDLWISTLGGGLNKYDPIRNAFSARLSSTNILTSPKSNDIYTVFSDMNGIVWLGYANGFSTFDPKSNTFQHYMAGDKGIPNLGVITHFAQTSNGKIWAATTDNGFLEIDPSSHKIALHQYSASDKKSIPSNFIYKLVVDRRDRIWLASPVSGVSVYDTISGEIRNFA